MTRLALPALALILVGSAPPADDPKLDPEARRLLDEVAATYKGLKGYADEGKLSIRLAVDGRPAERTWDLAVALARPDKIRVDAGDLRLIGDGKELTTVLMPTKKFVVAPAPKALRLGELAEGPIGAIILGGPGAPAARVLFDLLLADDPAAALLEGATALRLEPEREADGGKVRPLVVESDRGLALRLLIDPEAKLVRRIEVAIDPKALATKVPDGLAVADAAITWTAGTIRTEAPEADRFAFRAPEGFTKVKAAEGVAAKGPNDGGHELLGQAAPDFTLTVLDGAGKTKRVTKADLAGKVVLLDFWATWCPPCLAELPELQKLADGLAKSKKDVVIVAVSQDRAPDDDAPVRALVERTLNGLDLKLAGPVARVALDPEQAIGDAFKVEALPTLFLLDAKGVIQGVHIGNREDVADILAGEIDTLLGGEALIKAGKNPK